MARKVRIQILDHAFEANPDDSLLRALQAFGSRHALPDFGFARFCWNASCEQCVVNVDRGRGGETLLACQTPVREGTSLRSLPTVLLWSRTLRRVCSE
ncbi:MAG: (2Fe-2S)-binding protein [Candidatus Latescibacterota bacterium]|nr:MAG: (2Fe-2S)-binding protein [Candidatus Latescibacterota bacterium]